MSCQNAYTVRITPNAIANIKEIMDFYINAMSWPPAAIEFKEAFQEKLPLIEANPFMYGIPDTKTHHRTLFLFKRLASVVRFSFTAKQAGFPASPVPDCRLFDMRRGPRRMIQIEESKKRRLRHS